MGKILQSGQEARQKVLAGVEKLTEIVKVTMGPRGKNVIIGKSIGAPSITKDGVSVAREVVLDDPIENLGCLLVKEAAGRTAAVAGDGTTTSTVLTHSIFKEGTALIDSGYHPLHFRRGMEWGKKALVEELSKLAQPIDTDQALVDVATISANNDHALGQIIADAYISVDKKGSVVAEAKPGVPHSYRVIEGIELKSGYIHQGFLEEGTSKRELNKALVLICDEELTSTVNDPGIIEAFRRIGSLKKDILLICNDLKKEGLASVLASFKQGTLKIAAIKTPNFGAHREKWLQDLSMMTGATIVGGDQGIAWKDLSASQLGWAEKIVVESFQTKIINPRADKAKVSERIRLYEEFLPSASDADRESTLARLGMLRGKVAVITVGYSTELELREVGDRIEDAMFAVRAAIDEGYVVGGGFALWRAAQAVSDRIRGKEIPSEWTQAVEVLLRACMEPAHQIIRNADLAPLEVLSGLSSDPFFGYNTATEEYGNLVEMGVIDPKKVTRTALINAISIALLLITTDAVIADNPYNPSGWQPPAGYRMPKDGGLNHKY